MIETRKNSWTHQSHFYIVRQRWSSTKDYSLSSTVQIICFRNEKQSLFTASIQMWWTKKIELTFLTLVQKYVMLVTCVVCRLCDVILYSLWHVGKDEPWRHTMQPNARMLPANELWLKNDRKPPKTIPSDPFFFPFTAVIYREKPELLFPEGTTLQWSQSKPNSGRDTIVPGMALVETYANIRRHKNAAVARISESHTGTEVTGGAKGKTTVFRLAL